MKNMFFTLSFTLAFVASQAQWRQIDTVNQQYYGISFQNDEVGYIGGYGFYKKTMDGGATWQLDTLPGLPGYVKQFTFFDNNVVLIGGLYSDPSYVSTDSGNTWAGSSTLYPCFFLPGSYMGFSAATMPFGQTSPTFKTVDQGSNWAQQGWVTPDPNGSFTMVLAIAFADSLHGCITAGEGSIYITNDGGLSWARKIPSANLYNFTDVYMKDSLNIFIVGGYSTKSTLDDYIIMHTTDGGVNWTPVYESGLEISKITFPDSIHAFAGGYNLLQSTDGGDTWAADDSINYVVDLSFPSPRNGYLLTWDAILNRGTLHHLSLVNSIQSVENNLRFSIYPNPATNQLFIKTENIQPVSITIYDVNGRVIYTMPFTPEVDINELSTGVYFVEVKSNEGVVRKRFVKM